MKKKFLFFIFFIYVALIYTFSQSNIEKWISNFPKETNKILDYNIKNIIIEETGIVLELKKGETTIKIITIKKLSYQELFDIFSNLENSLFNEKNLKTENRNIQLKEIEINIGLRGEVITTIKFNSFKIKINPKTTVELVKKINNEVIFHYSTPSKEIKFNLIFTGINLNIGNNDIFPGWEVYTSILIEWFKKGKE